jgi:DNA-binding LytR/AlgR family response regulator
MNILIIEDEQPAINKLERFLKEMDENYRITGILGSVEESLNWLHSNPPPDLILMDIQLEDGLCFEIFENLSIKSPVIFTTAYDEYTLRAFKVNSVDYLLKPIQQQELKKALDKFREFHSPGSSKNWTREILGSFGSGTKERFLVKSGTYYRSVPVKDIYCFYVKMKYNFLLLNGL